jgi:perosamine synthetase
MIPAARPLIGEAEIRAVERVLRSGGLAQGPEVAAFEAEFSSLVEGRECVAVNSGTSALHLGMVAAGIGAGDEIIVPSFTFAATANAVRLAGAQPVFVDIDPKTFCMSPDSVSAAITPRTAGIMPVHLYGHPADMDRLAELARMKGLLLIEDAAQAHAAAIRDSPVGTFGDIAAFSFYPTKNMTSGEGGMVVASCPDVARRVRLLRNQGMERQYQNEIIGFNARMTDIGAAIGRVQLTKLSDWTDQRRANARALDVALAEVAGVVPPYVADGVTHVYHQYTLRIVGGPGRDGLQQRLAKGGVGSGVYYPTPVHLLPSFALTLDLPETARAAVEVLSIPVHPSLGPESLATVAHAIEQAMGE